MSGAPPPPDPVTGSRRGRFLGSGILPRTLVALVGAPLLIWLGYHGGLGFQALVLAVVLLGLREYELLARAAGRRPFQAAMLLLGGGVAAGLERGWPAVALITAAVLVLSSATLLRRDRRGFVADVATSVFGVVYVALPGAHLGMLRGLEHPDPLAGARALGLLAAVTWACDTFAYVVGVSMGRTPLVPSISPKKSREGAVGGLLAAGAAGWLVAETFGAPLLSPLAGLTLGLICGVAGQVGDLVESALKRDAGVKDTAGLLPGHGGVLDRFDSLFFNAPILYWALALGWAS